MKNSLVAGYKDQYEAIIESITNITEEQSLISPTPNINLPHWILGHILVARLNILVLLGESSIYPAEIFRLFIPGSTPVINNSNTISFTKLTNDFISIHVRFLEILSDKETDLEKIIDGKSVVGHLLTYLTHEAFHAGQLSILADVLNTA